MTSFLDGRFRNGHRLEPALQCRILLDVLAVFIEGGSTDDLNLATGQGRLQNIGRIHRAFRIACANKIVDLVDDQNDVAALLDLADQALHAALELPPELGAGNQCRQIQQEHFLIPQLIGHIPGGDPLGKTLSNGSLTHTGLTDQARVILLAAVQNLDDPLGLHIPADDLIQLAFSGPTGQVHAVAIQEFMLLGLLFLGFFPFRLLLGRMLRLLSGQIGAAAEELVQQREGRGLAFGLIVIAILIVTLTEHAAHLISQQIQILLGHTHLLHGLVDLGDSQTPGAFQAVALI